MKTITKNTTVIPATAGTASSWAVLLCLVAIGVQAQDSSIYIQCPEGPNVDCIHLAAGDGMITMADDAQKPLYIFSFSEVPLPGVGDAPLDPSEYAGWVMEEGLLAANAPAPTIAVDEDDQVYLQLTNVGMVLRPDLSDPHTVHWHGFPNASSAFDGVPESSVSVNMGATLTYFYQPVDAGTYMYHCHVEATEHMQMGMLGNLYVRPRQNRLADGMDLAVAFENNSANLANGGTTPAPAPGGVATLHNDGDLYAYNDGDGSTRYDVEVPIQIGSFDPDFHDASYSVQPLPFRSMKDKYFLINGRGYPATVHDGPIQTLNDLGATRDSQPVDSIVQATAGDIVLLRISNLNVTLFNTIGTNGVPMKVIGLDARLLRDGAGNNLYYETTSLTLGGGQSADVLIDTTGLVGKTLYLYSKNLDRLANNAENFGGAMTEIRIN